MRLIKCLLFLVISYQILVCPFAYQRAQCSVHQFIIDKPPFSPFENQAHISRLKTPLLFPASPPQIINTTIIPICFSVPFHFDQQ